MNDDELRDAVEITQLINRIATAADAATDLDDYTAMMTPDVSFVFAANPATNLAAAEYDGHVAVRAGAEARRAAGVQGPGTGTLHIVSNVVVDAAHGDTAHATAYWRYYRIEDGGPKLNSMGTYDNTLRRIDRRWLLARRVVTVF